MTERSEGTGTRPCRGARGATPRTKLGMAERIKSIRTRPRQGAWAAPYSGLGVAEWSEGLGAGLGWSAL